ncbi:hypothetical protein IGI04_035922 [Brassica rapa subsp. trilocularis]|uniref:Uncharacterized protein n=1 Tax=Brassica rapa subsp. trilocularis TaxID=1813537 RepID=A0ABQ7LCZ5_BRACM|nr:hypothetical protein IGI04_035922 [Brassica rapa subsp. trilocularis]
MWVSASTHRTSGAVRVCPCVSVCVRQHKQDIRGCPSVHISARWSLDSARWPFPWTVRVIFGPRGLFVQYTQDVRGCPPAHTGRSWLFMAVRQHTQDVRGCPCVSVCVCVCPSAHTGRPWVSVSTHRWSVCVRQHTQDVRVCPSAHTGRPWLSVCICVSLSAHTGRLWLSISRHISTLVLGLSKLTLPVDCSGDFGPRGLCVQYTQDVRGFLPVHTGRPRLSECVHVCPSVSVSTHKTYVAVHQYTYQHVGPWTKHAGPSLHTGRPWVSASTDRTFVAVCGCPSAHTGRSWLSVCVRLCPSAHTRRPWVSVSTHRTSEAVRVCPCVSVSTNKISVAVHQYTYQHAGPWTQHADPSRGLFGHSWVSVSTHRTSVCVRQHTQDVRGCPCVSVCVRQHTQDVRGLSISTHISTLVLGLSTLTLPVDCLGDFGQHGCLLSTHRTSVGVRQHPHDFSGCSCVSVCVRLCPSAHTGRPWLSISTHISTLVLGLLTLALPVDCLGDFWPHRTSVGVRQHTHDVCGCPSAHTGRPFVSVSTHDVHGCPRVSVCVRQHTQDVRGCPSVHISACWSLDSGCCPFLWTVWVFFGSRGLSVQYTQDVRGCPPAHTGRPWLSFSTHRTSVAVRVCLCVSVSTHRTSLGVRQHTHDIGGCPCVSVCVRQHTQDDRGCPSVHISPRWSLDLSTLTLPVDCSGDFWPTWAVCSVHTGRPWVSASTHRTSVAVRAQDVCGCRSVHISARWSLDSAFWPFPWTVWVILAHVDCLFSTHRTSMGVRQHTQDVRGCLWLSVSPHRTSVAVCVCVCVRQHTQDISWLSISTHISTLVLGLSTLTLPVDCSGDFGPRGLSVQYTQNVCGCPSAHTGRPCVSVSTHRTFMAVRVCPSAHTGRPWLSISTHISTLVLGHSTLTFPVDCSCDFGPHGLSVQYTQDVCGCPPAHTGRQWLSVCVRVCPSMSVSTHRMSVVVHQYTYQQRWSLDSAR